MREAKPQTHNSTELHPCPHCEEKTFQQQVDYMEREVGLSAEWEAVWRCLDCNLSFPESAR